MIGPEIGAGREIPTLVGTDVAERAPPPLIYPTLLSSSPTRSLASSLPSLRRIARRPRPCTITFTVSGTMASSARPIRQPIDQDATMASSSYTNNGSFNTNPASYTRPFFGSPISWRAGSFGSRFYHAGNSPGQLLGPLEYVYASYTSSNSLSHFFTQVPPTFARENSLLH